MKSFSKYLLNLRLRYDLTQQAMINHLIEWDDSFGRLDITTYSRWERGVTRPKKSKQILLAQSFGESIDTLLDESNDVSQDDIYREALDLFVEKINPPYVNDSDDIVLHEGYFPLEKAQKEINSFHNEYLQLAVGDDVLSNNNIAFSLVETKSGHIIGHFIYSFIYADTPNRDLELNHSKNIYKSLNQCSDQALSLYIISGYNMIPEFRLGFVFHTIEVLKNNPNVKFIVLNCSRDITYRFLESATEYEILGKGPVVAEGGVKVFGKRYSYIRLKIKAESFLATKDVLKLIPFSEEMLEKIRTKLGHDS
ncbi:helix-turn-helix domain-containing protein [Vibrio campbellii]